MSWGRPSGCPDPQCVPLYGLAERAKMESLAPGDSYICFGRMAEPDDYTAHGVRHLNDLCSCHYTPRLGQIRFYENLDDWRSLQSALGDAIARAESEPGSVSELTPEKADTESETPTTDPVAVMEAVKG